MPAKERYTREGKMYIGSFIDEPLQIKLLKLQAKWQMTERKQIGVSDIIRRALENLFELEQVK